jgi:hypothetical protein
MTTMHSIPLIPAAANALRRGLRLLVGVALLSTSAFAHPTTSPKDKPAASRFGFGPWSSDRGLYTATLQSEEPLRARRPQKVSIVICDAAGQPVEDATIAIDGGMPQHGHGLPTQPRAVHSLTGGIYTIEGLRFNMGGWWELTFAINGPAGADRVIFHLKI